MHRMTEVSIDQVRSAIEKRPPPAATICFDVMIISSFMASQSTNEPRSDTSANQKESERYLAALDHLSLRGEW